jgi:hypothetical protein
LNYLPQFGRSYALRTIASLQLQGEGNICNQWGKARLLSAMYCLIAMGWLEKLTSVYLSNINIFAHESRQVTTKIMLMGARSFEPLIK